MKVNVEKMWNGGDKNTIHNWYKFAPIIVLFLVGVRANK